MPGWSVRDARIGSAGYAAGPRRLSGDGRASAYQGGAVRFLHYGDTVFDLGTDESGRDLLDSLDTRLADIAKDPTNQAHGIDVFSENHGTAWVVLNPGVPIWFSRDDS